MFYQQVTEIGLSLMTEEARKEKLDAIYDGNTVDCKKLADLIDECTAIVGVFIDQHQNRLEAEMIRERLKEVNGAEDIKNTDAKDLAEWILPLRDMVE